MWRKWPFILCSLLMALALSACGAGASSINTIAQQQLLESPFQKLQVSTQIPHKMLVGVSYAMRITLRPREGYVSLSDIPAENATTSNMQPVPVGTPLTSVLNAFGPGYEPYATARLGGGAFTLQLISQETQSLRQSTVTWEWNVTPLYSGTQIIDGSITIEWTPTSANAHALPANPTFTVATMDTSVDVSAPAATPTSGPDTGIIDVGPFAIDQAGLTTTILGALIVAVIAWLSRRAYTRTKAFQRAALKKRRPPTP